MNLSANFIGCGKLGKTIAYLLHQNNLIYIQDIFNNSEESNLKSIEFIGAGNSCSHLNSLEPADVIFICTPDDCIKNSCDQIIQQNKIKPKTIFVHFSGVLSSEELKSASEKGHFVCSVHPVKSFVHPEISILNFKGVLIGMEGDNHAIQILSTLMMQIGGIPFLIEKEKKVLYHTGAVFASNYLIAIASLANSCFIHSGVSEEISKKLIVSLMQGTVENMSKVSTLSQALTGPIQRGDVETIKKHRDALAKETDENFDELYALLGKAVLNLTNHDAATRENLKNNLIIS